MLQSVPILGHFSLPGNTAAANTAFARGVPPYPGPNGQPAAAYSYSTARGPNWTKFGGAGAHTVVTYFEHLMGSTVHTLTWLRPLNFTTVNGAVAKNTTSIVLTADPGLYSTNYKYPSVNGYAQDVADNAIAGGDYFAVQLADGSWFFDLVSSMSSLTVTTTTTLPNPTTNAGGILDQAVFFFFGVLTDVDPATGYKHPQTVAGVASTREVRQDNVCGLVSTLRPGDPMIFHNANATAQSWLGLVAGVYARF